MTKAFGKILFFFAVMSFLYTPDSYAQPKRNDYKKISKLTFYGAVYEGTRIIKANKTTPEYKQVFLDVNKYYQENPDAIATSLKRALRITLDGIDVSYANIANERITELDLFTYKDHTDPGTFESLQSRLERLKIPRGEGYGLVLFSYRVDYKEGELKYDLVFFDRQTMRIIAFGDSESEKTSKDTYKEFCESIPEAIREYRIL